MISLLLAYVPDESLPRVLTVRCGRVMAEAGVSDHAVLAEAIRDALAGETRSVTDDEPLGVALRTAGLKDAKAAAMLRLILAGRRFDALTTDFYLHRITRTPGWREQFIADFGDLVVPPGDMAPRRKPTACRNAASASRPARPILNRRRRMSGA